MLVKRARLVLVTTTTTRTRTRTTSTILYHYDDQDDAYCCHNYSANDSDNDCHPRPCEVPSLFLDAHKTAGLATVMPTLLLLVSVYTALAINSNHCIAARFVYVKAGVARPLCCCNCRIEPFRRSPCHDADKVSDPRDCCHRNLHCIHP